MVLKSLESYGSSFQLKVISSLLTHKTFLVNIYDVLNPQDFSSSSHQWIVEKIVQYYDKYHSSPDIDFLKVEVKKIELESLQFSVKEQLKEAYKVSEEDLEYVKEEFSTFCLNQKLKQALLQSVDMLKVGQYDDIRSVINTALKAGQDKNVGHEYEKDIESRYREDARKAIPFPWPAFNNITQGGYGSGDLVLIFGNPKGGKSWAIIAMAAEAVKMGLKVVYYSLELGENYVGKRFDSYFANIDVSQIDKHRSQVEGIVKDLPGTLVIKEYSPKRASLATIENHIQTLEFKPDVIFIDYLDLLKNRTSRAVRKDDIDDVYTDAKGLAKELNIPLVSPSQANRSGAEKEILESVHIGGSFEKLMIADLVISLARGRTDRINGTGRWHFMGNRYGKDGVTFFSPKIDTSTGHIEINEKEMDEDEIFDKTVNKNEFKNDEKKYLLKEFEQMEL